MAAEALGPFPWRSERMKIFSMSGEMPEENQTIRSQFSQRAAAWLVTRICWR